MFIVFYDLFILCLVFQAINFVDSNNTTGTVIFANVVFRHGQRTPFVAYPTDPYKNISYWPDGFAELTNMGKSQLFELGEWLRVRYDSLLTKKYHHDIIHVRSIDLDRSLMSAECNLAGMYPPEDGQIWNADIRWQPIPVHGVPEKLDNMLAAKKPCPAYEKEFQRMLQTKEVQDLNASFHDVFETLNEYSGERVTTIEQINWLYGTLSTENLYNLSLPKWTKSIYPQRMEEASVYSYVLPTYNKKLARLKSGVLVKELISNMKRKKENDPQSYHLNIYSGHGTTLGNLLNTLGVNNMIHPPFAACLMMELSVDSTGDHQVTMFYRNFTIGEPYLLTLPNCTPVCPLDQFIRLLEPVTVDDWDSECQEKSNSFFSTLTIIALIVLMSLVLMLLTSGVIYGAMRKRSTQSNTNQLNAV